MSKVPVHVSNHAAWERLLSKVIHALLYTGLLVMPMSGWMMSSAADFPAAFFGYEMPDLIAKDEASARLLRNVHGWGAVILIAALSLHTVGAFKHHFIDKDATLQRMTRANLGLVGGVALTLLVGVSLLVPSALFFLNQFGPDQVSERSALRKAKTEASVILREKVEAVPGATATAWNIDSSDSHIHFEATQYGVAFQGEFGRFDGHIFFDPKDLKGSKADIVIDITSINTGSTDRDSQALDSDWFDASHFPRARFETGSFDRTGPNLYEATANLTIRDITQIIVMPFTVEFTGDGQSMKLQSRQLSLNRLAFKVGQGLWATGDTIGVDVAIDISVALQRK